MQNISENSNLAFYQVASHIVGTLQMFELQTNLVMTDFCMTEIELIGNIRIVSKILILEINLKSFPWSFYWSLKPKESSSPIADSSLIFFNYIFDLT